MCDRCIELEAEIEALRDELHDLRAAEVRRLSTAQAETRQRHPSTATRHLENFETRLKAHYKAHPDDAPVHGIVRPDLRLIGGD